MRAGAQNRVFSLVQLSTKDMGEPDFWDEHIPHAMGTTSPGLYIAWNVMPRVEKYFS